MEERKKATDARLFSPSSARNRDPILSVLRDVLPDKARVLEIASGTGEHGVHICQAMPGLLWRPSDLDEEARTSQAAWAKELGLGNFLAPLTINSETEDWSVGDDAPFDALVCINMIHISPWRAGLGVIAGAGRYVAPGGLLYFYGPFVRNGAHTAPSNEQFDKSLKGRNPDWGVRDIAMVAAEAAKKGFTLAQIVEMPANNLSAVFRKIKPDE